MHILLATQHDILDEGQFATQHDLLDVMVSVLVTMGAFDALSVLSALSALIVLGGLSALIVC